MWSWRWELIKVIATGAWEQQATQHPSKLMLIINKQSSPEFMIFISDAWFPILVLACHFSLLCDANGKPTMHLKSPTDRSLLIPQGAANLQFIAHTVKIHDHVQLV